MTKPVELRVGGSTYRVISSASAEELERLAGVVDETLAGISPPGRPMPPQAMLLAAIALAHEVEVQRERADRIAARSREKVSEILARLDGTIARAEDKLRHADQT
ncbi:MAG: cell division protein ZapA [Myxococcales bacterium]|jgi:cell division protein ZapA|nr:cell division protein ZapA [Myxococcales bacterium]